MSVRKIFGLFGPAGMAIALLPASQVSWSQTEQVLSEVAAMGHVANGDEGVVKPDFPDELSADYADWIEVASNRNFKSFALSVFGTALVLDGTTILEFNASGQEKNDRGFPVDCTNLPFEITKPNGQTSAITLTGCTAFTPLNDGTIRIAGEAKGTGFVILAYDPESGGATWKATVPQAIADMDGDEYADSGERLKAGYWAAGNRKEILFFPLEPAGSEKNFKVVATINGVNLHSVTPFGTGRVIVALDTGELVAVNTATGGTTSFAAAPLPTGAACGLAKNDPQKFSVRGDPSGVLFAGNMGCHSITVFDASGQPIPASDSFTENPFVLGNPAFHVEGLDWQIGESGDFVDCQIDDQDEACEFGKTREQGILWDVEVIGKGDTTFRMFQFVDLVDCRWSGDLPCPILNCPEADGEHPVACPLPEDQQILDLAQLLVRADPTGAFRQMAFGDGLVPVMAIPAYMRGEETYPHVAGGLENNDYKFHTSFAVTNAVFTGNFFTDYKIDFFRENSSDPCDIPEPGTLVEDVNETANLIVYNSDKFGTVDRENEERTHGGIIVNDACNGRAIGSRWSAQTVGLELYDERDDAYVHHATRMMQELIQANDELLCSKFPDPDGGAALGPLLPGSDCSRIGSELDQMQAKLATCFGSLYAPQSGGSEENCSAFFTKVQNLQNVLSAAPWPIPPNANQEVPDVLRPNYEGEFRGRLATLLFFIDSYVFNSVPPGGFISQ